MTKISSSLDWMACAQKETCLLYMFMNLYGIKMVRTRFYRIEKSRTLAFLCKHTYEVSRTSPNPLQLYTSGNATE